MRRDGARVELRKIQRRKDREPVLPNVQAGRPREMAVPQHIKDLAGKLRRATPTE